MLNSPQTYKWLDYIKQIFNETGNTYIFEAPNHINTNNVHQTIKQTLMDQFLQEWEAKLNTSNKGKHFLLFKNNIKLEKYITSLPSNLSTNLIKFRIANHRLPVEVQRWSNIPHNLRYCPFCLQLGLRELGDEFHYVLVCPHFTEQRRKLIPRYYSTRPNIIKYIELMKCNNINMAKRTSLFTRKIMDAFTNTQ